jgi:hypothetical protein
VSLLLEKFRLSKKRGSIIVNRLKYEKYRIYNTIRRQTAVDKIEELQGSPGQRLSKNSEKLTDDR